MNTKLCVRDAEFTERTEQLRRDAERLRRVRARVRDVIATDEALRRTLEGAAWDNDHDALSHSTPQESKLISIYETHKQKTISKFNEKMI